MKNILVTGAAGNLGSVVVEKFLKEGHRVIALLSPEGKWPALPPENLVLFNVNLADDEEMDQVIASVTSRFQHIDAAIMLAGGYAWGGISQASGEATKKMYTLNFETAYFTARPVFLQMMEQPSGGRLVFVGARPALQAADGRNSVAYALSKSLIFSLSELLNAEGASKNVSSAVVVPSIIDTPINRTAMPSADFNKWVTPADVAEVISFFVSEAGAPLRDTVLKVYGNA